MRDRPADDDKDPLLLILDASTIINFIDVNAWQTLTQLDGFVLATPKIVARQVEVKERRKRTIRDAVSSGSLRLLDEQVPPILLELFVDAARRFGEQDAAVLLHALVLNAGIAADDRSLCNEARRQGVRLILGTEALLVGAVGQGLISLAQGNRRLRKLREYRFDSREPCLCSLLDTPCCCLRA